MPSAQIALTWPVGSIEARRLPSTWPGFRRRVRQTDRRVCRTRKPTLLDCEPWSKCSHGNQQVLVAFPHGLTPRRGARSKENCGD